MNRSNLRVLSNVPFPYRIRDLYYEGDMTPAKAFWAVEVLSFEILIRWQPHILAVLNSIDINYYTTSEFFQSLTDITFLYPFTIISGNIWHGHYDDVTMSLMASQITSLTIIYLTGYSDADQRKHQSSASLAFVRGIHRGPVNSPHNWPVTRKMFPFDDVIMAMGFFYWQSEVIWISIAFKDMD